jgi:hypothetical protein
MATPSVYYDDNTGYLVLDELRDSEAAVGTFINAGATVTLESIKTLGGVSLTGMTFPTVMPYVTGTDGKYRVKVPDTLAGVPNETTVEANVKVVVGTDIANFHLRFPFRRRIV